MSTAAERAATQGGPPLDFVQARNAAGEMRRLRRKQELSQRDLAARIGKTASWVSFRETGAARLRKDDAEMVAAALGTDLPGLTGGAS